MQKVTFLKSSEFQPTKDFLMVKPQEEIPETITASGIILTFL
jgi:co-chaperonin GroES (HSP10)